jgi:tetratricopeptide (TPR) repeat protein
MWNRAADRAAAFFTRGATQATTPAGVAASSDLEKKGDLDRAIAEYIEAIRLNPEYAPALLGPRHCMGDQSRSARGIG